MQHAWHLYVVQLELEQLTISRNEVIAQLGEAGIGTSVHRLLRLAPFNVQAHEDAVLLKPAAIGGERLEQRHLFKAGGGERLLPQGKVPDKVPHVVRVILRRIECASQRPSVFVLRECSAMALNEEVEIRKRPPGCKRHTTGSARADTRAG